MLNFTNQCTSWIKSLCCTSCAKTGTMSDSLLVIFLLENKREQLLSMISIDSPVLFRRWQVSLRVTAYKGKEDMIVKFHLSYGRWQKIKIPTSPLPVQFPAFVSAWHFTKWMKLILCVHSSKETNCTDKEVWWIDWSR
jgi:hypothetical protein